MSIRVGLLDTSIFVASETGRHLDSAALPEESYVSVITLAELQVGVLVAKDTFTRGRRLATLHSIGHVDPLPVDVEAAARWAELRARLVEVGQSMDVNALWIAAIAAANQMPIFAQDNDFAALKAIGGPQVLPV